MAQLDFYGTKEDIVELLDFMFDISKMKLFEARSIIDGEIREFVSGKDLLDSDHIEDNHGRISVVGWWTSVTDKPFIKKRKLNPNVGNFRYTAEGVGTFRIHQGELMDLAENSMNRSTLIHWNEAGAKERAYDLEDEVEEINWKEFRRLSGIVHRHVRNKMYIAQLNKAPILSGAFKHLIKGGNIWGLPRIYNIDSCEIVVKNS
jgi:hypothetical protein